MFGNTIKVWKLSKEDGTVTLDLPDTSTLDVVTRQLPQGYYSTFRTFDGGRRVLGLGAHLQRLYQPADVQKITPAISSSELRQRIAEFLRDYPNEARVRLVMAMNGDIYIALTHLIAIPPEIYQYGVKVITIDVQRGSPRVKSTAFIAASENTRAQIARSEVFEALLLRKNIILEGMTSNFFYVKDGLLGTARNNILLGVTRRTVLRVARGSGFSIAYRPLKLKQISALSEAFLTSSSRGIVPIVQIDNTTVGEGIPGPITNKMTDNYKNYVMQHAEII
jgi:branched-chain amino acid aminotransferase